MADSMADVSKRIARLEQKVRSHNPSDRISLCGHSHLHGGTLMKTHTQLVKRFLATLLFSTLVFVSPNSPAADSLDDGIQAYKAGDYKEALEIL